MADSKESTSWDNNGFIASFIINNNNASVLANCKPIIKFYHFWKFKCGKLENFITQQELLDCGIMTLV